MTDERTGICVEESSGEEGGLCEDGNCMGDGEMGKYLSTRRTGEQSPRTIHLADLDKIMTTKQGLEAGEEVYQLLLYTTIAIDPDRLKKIPTTEGTAQPPGDRGDIPWSNRDMCNLEISMPCHARGSFHVQERVSGLDVIIGR